MLLITLAFIALTLMICAYTFKRPAVSVAGGVLWLLFGLWSLSISTVTWDIYYDLFIVGIGLFIMGLVEAMSLRPKIQDEAVFEDYWDRAKKEYDQRQVEQNERLQQFKNAMAGKKNNKSSVIDEL